MSVLNKITHLLHQFRRWLTFRFHVPSKTAAPKAFCISNTKWNIHRCSPSSFSQDFWLYSLNKVHRIQQAPKNPVQKSSFPPLTSFTHQRTKSTQNQAFVFSPVWQVFQTSVKPLGVRRCQAHRFGRGKPSRQLLRCMSAAKRGTPPTFPLWMYCPKWVSGVLLALATGTYGVTKKAAKFCVGEQPQDTRINTIVRLHLCGFSRSPPPTVC